jgi:hypothetical protein
LLLKNLNIQKSKLASKDGVGYLGHHFFPDKFDPVRFPDFMAFPTHLHKDRIESVLLPGLDRKCLLIWQPTASLCYQTGGAFVPYYFNDVEASGASLVGGNYLSYNGATTNVNGTATSGGVLAVNNIINTTSWPKAHIGLKTATNIRKSRLLSAYIKIEYTGKPLEASGILRVGMGIKRANDDLNGFKLADITSLPIASTFDGDEDLFLQYRHADELNYQMGPFDATTYIPYIIIYGEGLSSTASYKITSFRTFESIVDENMMELVNPLKEDSDANAQHAIKALYGQFSHSPLMSNAKYNEMASHFTENKVEASAIEDKLPDSMGQLVKYYNVLKKQDFDRNRWQSTTKDWGYLLHHYFPDKVSGRRFPDALAFPTSISSHKTEIILPVAGDGRIAIYFNPSLSCTDLTRVFFACNSTANVTVNSAPAVGSPIAGNIIDFTSQQFFEPTSNSSLNPIAWPTKYFGYPSSDKYKQVRLISAFLKIEYIGKPLDNSGFIKVCMFPKTQLESGDGKMTVKPTTMQNQPIYGSFNGDDDLLTFYRHIDDTFYTMGPYASNAMYPVTLLYGEGMTSGASYKVTITRTFEGIPLDNLIEFTNPLKEEPSNVGSGMIKSRYGAIDVPPFSKVSNYEESAAKVLDGLNEEEFGLTTNQKILNLYNRISAMSTTTAPNPLPTYGGQRIEVEYTPLQITEGNVVSNTASNSEGGVVSKTIEGAKVAGGYATRAINAGTGLATEIWNMMPDDLKGVTKNAVKSMVYEKIDQVAEQKFPKIHAEFKKHTQGAIQSSWHKKVNDSNIGDSNKSQALKLGDTPEGHAFLKLQEEIWGVQ